MSEFDFSKTYYKITNKEETHNGYQYHDGLNVDPNQWSARECSAGGFYFSDIENIFTWISYRNMNGVHVREVTVPEDALTSIEEYKFKANKIILGERKELSDINTIKYLLEQGANIHSNDDRVLYWAVNNGHLEIVKYLVEQGADIHIRQEAPLFLAAGSGYLDIVKYLVGQGSDIHADNGRALRWAADNGHLDIVKYLVEQGANIHADNDQALRWAAESGHLEIVKYLVEQGADIHADDEYALRWAAGNGHLEVVEYLMDQYVGIGEAQIIGGKEDE